MRRGVSGSGTVSGGMCFVAILTVEVGEDAAENGRKTGEKQKGFSQQDDFAVSMSGLCAYVMKPVQPVDNPVALPFSPTHRNMADIETPKTTPSWEKDHSTLEALGEDTLACILERKHAQKFGVGTEELDARIQKSLIVFKEGVRRMEEGLSTAEELGGM